MKLDIFIVGFKAEKELATALASIALWSKPGYRLTLHDNSVVNYSLTWLWNRFIEQSPREAIALVNPDVIVGPGWDSEAMDLLQAHPSCAAAMPLTNQGSHASYYQMPDVREAWMDQMLVVTGELKRKLPQRFILSKDRTMVSGHCMIVRKAAWKQLGGFGEQWPFANNDFDFNDRALARGMDLGVCLNSAVFHQWGSSTRDAKASGVVGFNTVPPGTNFSTV